ncbi:hypothetical protein AVEN_61342-1 [Araneus ventricosus]|uniref:Uncharacterized protein n=1 Tax=Araneus ventricosus TaxID=182803 RepID=A0A4Y2MT33_ARAVE|nr:hypothetical protein AVEN_61342-1 [Araneus ventricosus]
MARRTPELAPPLRNFALHQRKDVWREDARFGAKQAHIHGGSSIELGFKPGTLYLRSRDLTIRPPRPPKSFREHSYKQSSLLTFDFFLFLNKRGKDILSPFFPDCV